MTNDLTNSEKLNIVIIGRPNVGKSSFFNKFAARGNNRAIIYQEAGTTIDYKTNYSEIFDANLTDTAGLSKDLTFSKLCNYQTELALLQGHLCLFVIDGSVGVTESDVNYVRFLRKTRNDIPVILVVNKCDTKGFRDVNLDNLPKLGLGIGINISSEQNIGFGELAGKIKEILAEIREKIDSEKKDDATKVPVINFSIIGRPNVGKSTLLNRMFGGSRTVVSEIAGTTRDTISVEVSYEDYLIKLSDTAGIRKNDADKNHLEVMSVNSALISIQFANIAALVIDGTVGMEKQDLIIGEHVITEGRALMIIINKWDKVKHQETLLESVRHIAEKYLAHAPILTISAKTGLNCETIYPKVIKLYNAWIKRIKTSNLNKWLYSAIKEHEHRLGAHKKAVKIKFITQHDIRPPRFFISVNKINAVEESYKKYLINYLREQFGFEGVPIRVDFGASKNPYDNANNAIRKH